MLRLHQIIQDLRYGLKALRRQPAFAAVAIVTLALGIGANTAIFSVINAVMLRPLPFKNGERLVHIWSKDPAVPDRQYISYPDFDDWRNQSRTFERMAAFTVIDGVTLRGESEPERVDAVTVFGDLFPMLDVQAAVGTTFGGTGEFKDSVAVISHRLWQRRFNSDPGIVGRSIAIDNDSFTVIGVMPSGFQFPIQQRPIDIWANFSAIMGKDSPFLRRNFRGFEVMGLLNAGATIEQARSEMEVIVSTQARQYPEDKDFGILLIPELENLIGDAGQPLGVLFGAVGVVLLIACVNVANLLLAKAAGRKHEMGVRAALGAGRSRIYSQLLTENLILSMSAGVVGGFLAIWVIDFLVALAPANLPRSSEIGLDYRVLGFTSLISILAGILFGLAPAWSLARIDLRAALQEGSRTTSETGGRKRLRDSLVVAEIALALMLLTAAGLLLNSFWQVLQLDPGVDRQNVVSFMMNVSYSDPGRLAEFPRRLQEEILSLPGVRGASVFTSRPPSFGVSFAVEGRPQPPNEAAAVNVLTIQPGFLNALAIPLISGRDFTQRDDDKAPPVVIINETLARRYFPNEDPVGKRLQVRVAMTGRVFPMKEIVGVAGDTRMGSAERELRPQIYFPAAQDALILNYFLFLVKTQGDPLSVVPAIRAAVLSVDRNQPIYDVSTLEQQASQTVGQERFNALLVVIFAGLALVMAAIGLYGVLSYAVAQRTGEIGIRVALGAGAQDVLRLIAMKGLKLIACGVVIGLIGSIGLTRLIESLLFGVSATDPLTFTLVTLLLIAVAFLACWIPARRAAKLDPILALRNSGTDA